MFTRKVWVVCFVANALLNISFIDFVPYVCTLYLNEHSLNAWLIVLQLYLGYHANFF